MVPGEGEFARVVKETQAPVVILGGAKGDDERGLLATVKSSLDQGGSGIAMGRNVWGSDRPDRMVAALAALIHDDASVDDAMDILNS